MSTSKSPGSFLSQYLAGLPIGLASYPQHLVKRIVLQPGVALLESQGRRDDLPTEVNDLIGKGDDEWLPEACGGAVYCCARDIIGDDRQFQERLIVEFKKLYSGPIFRVLMAVLSPSLVLMGAAKRWEVAHRGVTLTAQKLVSEASGRVGARLTMDSPPGLYAGAPLEACRLGFRQACETAGAEQADVRVEQTGRQILFYASWAK